MEQKKLIEEIIEFIKQLQITQGIFTTYDRDLSEGVKQHIVEQLQRKYNDGK